MDYYSASGMSMLFLVFFQTISIAWIFGTSRFCDCIEQMSGSRPSWFFYVCWCFFGPLVMAVRNLISTWLLLKSLKLDPIFILKGCIFILRHSIHPSNIRWKLPIPLVGGSHWNHHQLVFHVMDSWLCCLLHRDDSGDVKRSCSKFYILNNVTWIFL